MLLKALLVLVLLSQLHFQLASKHSQTKSMYFVYMGKKQHQDHDLTTKLHYHTLAQALGSLEMARDALVHSYKYGFSGFAALITSAQADLVSRMPGVLRVCPSGIAKVHTTHSWDFIDSVYGNGSRGALEELQLAETGADVIIGVIDSGIWPEAESFNDKGMPPVPERWKGICQPGQKFSSRNCNRKIIGAMYFDQAYKAENGKDVLALRDYQSPRDNESHGTHVAATAAGRLVRQGNSMARGGAPLARLAIYKAVYAPDGSGAVADVVAAIDQAIHDGVDIISFSAGLDDSLISLATFHAAENGILFVASAGNEGPALARVSNTAPWILTVAASSTDRSFEVPFQLGNSTTETHKAKYFGTTALPTTGLGWQNLMFVIQLESLNVSEAEGNYVAFEVEGVTGNIDILASSVMSGGALGVIVVVPPKVKSELPWFQVSPSVFSAIHTYSIESESPMINFGNVTTVFGDEPAATLATFSSRGPGQLFPDTLKPDVTAPGVDILAAVPPPNRKVSSVSKTMELMSGTSMSCPHVSGVAALVKSLHPKWSPAAIISAIITTASVLDNTGDVIHDMYTQDYASPLGYGAGHIRPLGAADPGLVYDASAEDYERFLCAVGYTSYMSADNQSRVVERSLKSNCSGKVPLEASQLNHPSITVSTFVGESRAVKRIVTNVGGVNSTYKVSVEEPHGVKVTVKPDTLEFDESVRTREFEVTVMSQVKREYSFGSLTWTDGVHKVRSPIFIQSKY